MTGNQIDYAKHKEAKRANLANESIKASEAIAKRVANELQAEKQAEDARHNRATEVISGQEAASKAQSAAASMMQAQVAQARAQEEARHNAYDESQYGLKYGSNLTKTADYITGALTNGLPRSGAVMDAIDSIYNKVGTVANGIKTAVSRRGMRDGNNVAGTIPTLEPK